MRAPHDSFSAGADATAAASPPTRVADGFFAAATASAMS